MGTSSTTYEKVSGSSGKPLNATAAQPSRKLAAALGTHWWPTHKT